MKLLTLAALAATLLLCSLTAQQSTAPAKADSSAAPVSKPTKKAPQKKADGSLQFEMSLGELVTAYPSLDKLFRLDLPVSTSIELGKTVSVLKAEVERFEEQRLRLVKKYANGKPAVPQESMEAFSEDMKTLTEYKVEFTIKPVSLAMLGPGVRMSAHDMSTIEPFLIP